MSVRHYTNPFRPRCYSSAREWNTGRDIIFQIYVIKWARNIKTKPQDITKGKMSTPLVSVSQTTKRVPVPVTPRPRPNLGFVRLRTVQPYTWESGGRQERNTGRLPSRTQGNRLEVLWVGIRPRTPPSQDILRDGPSESYSPIVLVLGPVWSPV